MNYEFQNLKWYTKLFPFKLMITFSRSGKFIADILDRIVRICDVEIKKGYGEDRNPWIHGRDDWIWTSGPLLPKQVIIYLRTFQYVPMG